MQNEMFKVTIDALEKESENQIGFSRCLSFLYEAISTDLYTANVDLNNLKNEDLQVLARIVQEVAEAGFWSKQAMQSYGEVRH